VPDPNTDIVIVGVGESSAVGRVPGKSSLMLHAEAAKAALEDAGVRKEDVDGVFTNDSYLDYHVRHAMAFAEHFGIAATAKLISTIGLGSGASSGLFIHYAANAIRSGQCQVVLAISADNLLSGMQRGNAVRALAQNRDKEFEAPYGPILAACFALVAQRYIHEYGLTPEQLASVGVTMRHHASLNPRAHMRDPITVDDVLASRMIASPFHLLDCSLVSDGGAAVVITTRERARDLRTTPIRVLGMGMAYGNGESPLVHNSLSHATDLLRIGTRYAARQAMGEASITHADVGLLMVYDCFAIMPILFLEAAGFCRDGEAGSFYAEGRARVDGDLPVNTHGGMMSYAHPGNPGGFFMFPELVRQLRGQVGGDRQVQDARIGMVTGYGGQMAFWPVTVLGRE
jgi:acetyl-CoA acetyltransferase